MRSNSNFFDINLFSCTASCQRFTWSSSVLFSDDSSPSTALASLFSAQRLPGPVFSFSSMNILHSPCAHVNTSIPRQGFPYLTVLFIPPMLLPCDEFSAYRKGPWSLNVISHVVLLNSIFWHPSLQKPWALLYYYPVFFLLAIVFSVV